MKKNKSFKLRVPLPPPTKIHGSKSKYKDYDPCKNCESFSSEQCKDCEKYI